MDETKTLLTCLMWLVSKLYPYSLSEKLRWYRNSLYTMWIKNFLDSVGNNSRIHYPCKLWGGGQKSISIGNNTTIQGNCILGCWVKYYNQSFTPSIIIGDDCNIGEHTHISAINRVSIGNGLLTGRYVYIGDNSHGGLSLEEASVPPIKRQLKSKGEVVIGNNVWIGDKATVLAGVHIGDNVIVAANAVVLSDVPSNSIVAGVPAKVVKQLKECQNQD